MRMIDIIHKKREGFHLDPAEIEYFVKGYADGSVPDYQASALMMAIFFNGMKEDELSHLVQAMVDSGDTIDLSDIQGVKVDKHSTGGVGDKTSLVVGPLVASVGVPVAKMSGRGLGHTGGTLDKLESIKGFKVELTRDEFVDNVNTIKLALAGQTGNLVPADKLMYALRDVTATVDSIPLIASSIMSKKIASGADAIVLDVKTGSGAFMKSLDEAKTLAETMVRIGERLHRKTIAVISDMNQPLGHEIGNANEIREVIATLKGEGPHDLLTLSLTLASHMTVLGGIYNTVEEARTALEEKINDGTAFEKFKTFIEAQGGDLKSLDSVTADYQFEVKAGKDGYLKKVNSELIGTAAMLLGAGRKEKGDPIDHAVGITMHKKIGESVSEDDILFTLHANSKDVEDAVATLQRSFEITEHDVSSHELIYEIVK